VHHTDAVGRGGDAGVVAELAVGAQRPHEEPQRLGDQDPRLAGRPSPAALSSDELLVLTGSTSATAEAPAPPGQTYRGRPIPERGCVGEAERALGAGAALGTATVVRDVDFQSVELARNDPRVVAAFSQWSACMRQKGHDYRDPWGPPNDRRFTGPRATPQEIEVATADVACKQRTGVVRTWFAADAAHQRSLIERQRDALERAREVKQAQLEKAAAVLLERDSPIGR
jgi:hypothetical protein